MNRWLVSILVIALTTPVVAQSPNDFLEEDDFDPTPPGAFQTAPGIPGGPGTPGMPPLTPPGGNPFPPPGTPNGGPSAGSGSKPSGPSAFGKGNSKGGSAPKLKFAQAHPEDITDENFPDLIDSFDYPNAEIADVVKAMSELTGKNFIVDPSIRGKITIMAPTRITVAEAYKAFLSALAINGLTVVPSGKFLKIVQARNATKDSLEIYSGAFTPNTDQMITRVIQLKHINAAEFNKFLGRSASASGNIDVYEPTNTVIVSDFGSNIERIMKIVQQIDVAGFDEQLAVIPIRHAKASEMADLIDQIINKGQSKKSRGAAFTAGIPRFGAPDQKTNQAYSMVIPDERTNSIIVVGNKEGINKIRTLVKQLDYDLPADEAGGIFVYYVKHGDAEKLAAVLSGLAQKSSTGSTTPGVPPGFPPPPPSGFESGGSGSAAGAMLGQNVKIAANKETNALIITASKQDYETVVSILKKIDIPRDQVYIEAIIMEMSVNGKEETGLSYYYFNKESNGIGRVGFAGQKNGKLLDVLGDSGTVLGFGQGDKVTIAGPTGTSVTLTSLVGFINFLKSVSNVDILSTPQVLALDNDKAIISVGDRIPVAPTTTSTATGASSGISFEEANTEMTIEPHIAHAENSIRMKVTQIVKAPSETQISGKSFSDSVVVLNTRKIESSIVVHHGDTAVLGGLMRNRDITSVTKVPLLGDLPLLGWFFRSTSNQKEKINLLVFLTPKIIRSAVDMSKNLANKLSERLDFIKQNNNGTDKHGLKFDNMAKHAAKQIKKAKDENADEDTDIDKQ